MGTILNINFFDEEKKMHDLIIIGGGPAGLTAAIYAGRALLKTLVIEKMVPGGLMAVTDKLENFPGFESISGGDLSRKMEAQAKKFGVEIEYGEVFSVIKNENLFKIKTDSGTFESKAVIYAAGSTPKKLAAPGEEEFIGRGVSYCAVCDGAFYKDLKVVVVGGGDSSLKEALFLTKFASEIVIVHRRDEFRAEKVIQEEVKKHPKISFILDSVVERISGEDFVTNVTVRNVKTGNIQEVKTDGIFIFIGYDPQISSVKELVEISSKGRIITDKNMQTKTEGLFAAGDVTEKLVNQVATAIGDGATAATAAEHFISKY